MSDIPKDDDVVLPQEGSTEDTTAFAGDDELAEVVEDSQIGQQGEEGEAEVVDEEAVEVEAEDDAGVPVIAEGTEAEAEVEEVEEEEEEEGPREPGLTTAGQYLAASTIAFMVVLLVLGMFFLALGRFPLEAGVALIVVPISLVCFACSIVGLLAKPEKREKLLLIPTLGPLLPLGAVILFIIAMLNEMKS